MTHRRDILAGLVGGAVSASVGRASAQSGFRSNRIDVRVQGSGPDLVLVPGLASTSAVWARTAERVHGRRLHLVSVRGFGDLGAGANAEGGILAPVAAEIGRYIRDARLEAPALVGHSMGGQMALRLAADAPRLVDRVMTVDASPFFPALISPGATAGDIEPIAQLAYQALQFLGDDVLTARGRGMGLDLGGASDAVFDAMGWQGGDRRVLAQALYEVMTVDLRHRLIDIAAPVTVVYGWSADDASPRHRADQLFRSAYASLRAPARFERVEGAEHMVMIDRPAQFIAALNRFLA